MDNQTTDELQLSFNELVALDISPAVSDSLSSGCASTGRALAVSSRVSSKIIRRGKDLRFRFIVISPLWDGLKETYVRGDGGSIGRRKVIKVLRSVESRQGWDNLQTDQGNAL